MERSKTFSSVSIMSGCIPRHCPVQINNIPVYAFGTIFILYEYYWKICSNFLKSTLPHGILSPILHWPSVFRGTWKKNVTTFCPSFGFWTTCCIRLNFLDYAQHIWSCFSAYSNYTVLLAVGNKAFIGNSFTKSLYLLSNVFGLIKHPYRNT